MLEPKKLTKINFLSSLDLSSEEVLYILELAENFKNKEINVVLNDNFKFQIKSCA